MTTTFIRKTLISEKNRLISNTMFLDEFNIPQFPLDRPSGK